MKAFGLEKKKKEGPLVNLKRKEIGKMMSQKLKGEK